MVQYFIMGKWKHHKYALSTVDMDQWEYHILSTYGISRQDYMQILEAQGGRCDICQRLPDKQRLHIDHSHRSGEVRGLLCSLCNRALGWMEKHREVAQKYLDREPNP